MTTDFSVLPHYYAPEQGERLFHYTSLEGALGILKTRSIWLSDFAGMNDPGEYRYARNCFLEEFRSAPQAPSELPLHAAITALLGLEIATNMFIGCLSQHPDDPHLWEHYGSGGTGCTIGIDAQFLSDWAGVTLRRVVYDRRELNRFVQGGLTMLQTQFKVAPDDIEELKELARYFVSDLYAFKHPDYRDENEIRVSRLVARNGDGLTDVGGSTRSGEALAALPINYRRGLRGPTPYLALPLYREGREAIQSIIIGKRGGDAVERIRALAWDGLEIVLDS